MRVVRVALRRPYSFGVLALLIAIFGVPATLNPSTDVFPNLDMAVACSPRSKPSLSSESGYFHALEGRHGQGTEGQID
jgi:hypothetical protein